MFGLMPRRRERTALATRPFGALGREFGSLFEPLFELPAWFRPMMYEGGWAPWAFTSEERENEIVLRAELPGFELTEIELTVRGNELTVRAEHKGAEGREEKVERTMTLPVGVEVEKIAATYRNGVLEVHVPRTPEATPRHIEVKT